MNHFVTQTHYRCIFFILLYNTAQIPPMWRVCFLFFLPSIFYTSAQSLTRLWRVTSALCSHVLVEDRVSVSPVLMSWIHHPAVPHLILLVLLQHLCSTLIGWGRGNLPPQTCFLPDPGARSVFLTNYRLPSEMICNVASSQRVTLPAPIFVTCQYLCSFSDVGVEYFRKKKKRSGEKLCPLKVKVFCETNER